MRIDDQYANWYKNKFGIELDKNDVLPVLYALQGHPGSGVLWARHIEKVDDFKVAEPTEHIVRDAIQAIGGK
eukprot:155164-Ditylum_brightwellii.AAC.1